jgi:penicillin V acylase-like amidase (Ntn superfamily)
MNGGWESNNVKWKSKYGSVVSSIVGYMEYSGLGPGQVCEGMDIDVDGASDGLNEKGLGAHLLYLGEEDGTQYAVPSSDSDVNLNYLRLVRYILDNFATVQEVSAICFGGQNRLIVLPTTPSRHVSSISN